MLPEWNELNYSAEYVFIYPSMENGIKRGLVNTKLNEIWKTVVDGVILNEWNKEWKCVRARYNIGQFATIWIGTFLLRKWLLHIQHSDVWMEFAAGPDDYIDYMKEVMNFLLNVLNKFILSFQQQKFKWLIKFVRHENGT